MREFSGFVANKPSNVELASRGVFRSYFVLYTKHYELLLALFERVTIFELLLYLFKAKLVKDLLFFSR